MRPNAAKSIAQQISDIMLSCFFSRYTGLNPPQGAALLPRPQRHLPLRDSRHLAAASLSAAPPSPSQRALESLWAVSAAGPGADRGRDVPPSAESGLGAAGRPQERDVTAGLASGGRTAPGAAAGQSGEGGEAAGGAPVAAQRYLQVGGGSVIWAMR